MLIAPANSRSKASDRVPKPYCQCWNKLPPMSWTQMKPCTCGEENEVSEWRWETPDSTSSCVVFSEDKKLVTFHPFYSSGTAAAKGDTPLLLNYHYYWEVKILTSTYGTDIMVGLGTDKVDITECQFRFTSLLGQDAESYGFSYTGAVRHDATVSKDSVGFSRGSIVGVRADMWRGTLEFYVNRKPLGVSFYNLRRHRALYPMVCSTAAQSSMKLIYAASWRASLLATAARALAPCTPPALPPGLAFAVRSHFWLTLPTDGGEDHRKIKKDNTINEDSFMKLPALINELRPQPPFVNGYYVDGVDRAYRLVMWE